jgi:hypothetical protein
MSGRAAEGRHFRGPAERQFLPAGKDQWISTSLFLPVGIFIRFSLTLPYKVMHHVRVIGGAMAMRTTTDFVSGGDNGAARLPFPALAVAPGSAKAADGEGLHEPATDARRSGLAASHIYVDVPLGTPYAEIQAMVFRQAWHLAGTQLRAALALGITPETISRVLRRRGEVKAGGPVRANCPNAPAVSGNGEADPPPSARRDLERWVDAQVAELEALPTDD